MTAAQRRTIRRLRQLLVRNFPLCFRKRGKVKLPLAFRIHKDLFRNLPDEKRADIELVLQDYTGGATYLAALIEGAERVDLDGNVVAVIGAREAARAAERLKRIHEHNARQDQKNIRPATMPANAEQHP